MRRSLATVKLRLSKKIIWLTNKKRSCSISAKFPTRYKKFSFEGVKFHNGVTLVSFSSDYISAELDGEKSTEIKLKTYAIKTQEK